MTLIEFRKLGGGRVMVNPALVAAIDDPWTMTTLQKDRGTGTLIRISGAGVIHVDHTMGEVLKMLAGGEWAGEDKR